LLAENVDASGCCWSRAPRNPSKMHAS